MRTKASVAIEVVLFLQVLIATVLSFPSDLSLDKLYSRLRSLAKKHSNLCLLEEIGKSVENRAIHALTIRDKTVQQDVSIVVEFGIHPREIASPSSGLFLVEQLLQNPACRGLIKRIKWFVIPLLNPDGYIRVIETAALWRKNCEPIPSSDCIGVDLNRNFPVGFENKTSSEYYCTPTYNGPEPLSEPESKVLKKFLDGLSTENITAYLAVHSCAKGIYYPYGYKKEKAANYETMELVAEKMRAAIEKTDGTTYRVGPAYEMGVAGGGVDEWVYDTFHIPLVYTFELDGDGYASPTDCFFPRSKTIRRLIRECFAGLEALALHIHPDALAKEEELNCKSSPCSAPFSLFSLLITSTIAQLYF